METEFDFGPLQRAITSLEAALLRHTQAPADDIVRDACIQRFEFTYELAHKMLRRFLEATSATPGEIAAMSFQDLIRTGSERGLLRNGWPQWKLYRAARAATSHSYDEGKAREVFAVIPGFVQEARFLQERLR